jgi:hypothetical protein
MKNITTFAALHATTVKEHKENGKSIQMRN